MKQILTILLILSSVYADEIVYMQLISESENTLVALSLPLAR